MGDLDERGFPTLGNDVAPNAFRIAVRRNHCKHRQSDIRRESTGKGSGYSKKCDANLLYRLSWKHQPAFAACHRKNRLVETGNSSQTWHPSTAWECFIIVDNLLTRFRSKSSHSRWRVRIPLLESKVTTTTLHNSLTIRNKLQYTHASFRNKRDHYYFFPNHEALSFSSCGSRFDGFGACMDARSHAP
jgi:hypothetical protein